MRVILLGPPGSGKSTQARLLADHLTVAHLSVGAALRHEIAAGTPLGDRVVAEVGVGELVAMVDVLAVLERPLAEASSSGGWVLDGVPRTVGQAEALDEWLDGFGTPADGVLALDVPADELRARLVQRGRADDATEVVEHRLQAWERDGLAVVAWYEQRGLLVRVDGTGDVTDVARRVVLGTGQLES